MDRRDYKLTKNKLIKIVISFILSGINIYLVVSLENWTKDASQIAVLLFGVAGLAASVLLTDRFLEVQERRLKAHALLWGAFMALAYVLGNRMRRDATAISGLGELPLLVLQVVCLSVLAAACIALFLRRSPLVCNPKDTEKYPQWKVGLFYAAVIFLCWLPVFLAYYPSVFAYDAEGQLYQVIAHDYSTHHPLLHTLFLGAFFRLGGEWFDSYQTGMALHSVVQMAMMAGTFGYTLSYLYRKGVSVYLRIGLLLFYALFPTNSILALSTTKDVLFSALVLLYTFSLYRMVSDNRQDGNQEVCAARGVPERTDAGRNGKKDFGMYVLWAVLMMLFRNNAVYAFVLSAPLIALGFRRVKGGGMWKRYLLCAVAALILFGVGSALLKQATGAKNGSPREMLSIPLQQMARTRVKAEETLPPKMRQELEQYLPSEWVFAAYNPYLADPVKNRAVIHDNPVGLIKTWMKLGMEYPGIYVDAFLDNSLGYWFLEDQTHAQIYGIGTESGFGYLSTDNRTMPAGCEIVEHSFLPGLRMLMEKIVSDNCYQKIPVLRIVFAPAFYWWMLCIYMAVAVYRRQYRLLLPVAFLGIYYMTLLLSPTVLVRYMYPFVVTVPALCCCLSTEGMHSQPNL